MEIREWWPWYNACTMELELSDGQLEAIRPYVNRLKTQGPGEGSESGDGAISLENTKLFPEASQVHVWKLGEEIIVDIAGPNGNVRSINLDSQMLQEA